MSVFKLLLCICYCSKHCIRVRFQSVNVQIAVIMNPTSCIQIVKNVSKAAGSSETLVTTYPTTRSHTREQ
jgi:hypothetical protein